MNRTHIAHRGFYIHHQTTALLRISITSAWTSYATLLSITQPNASYWVNTSQATLYEGEHEYTVEIVLLHMLTNVFENVFDEYFKTCRYRLLSRSKTRVFTPPLPHRRACTHHELAGAAYHFTNTSAFPYTLKTSSCELRRFTPEAMKRCLRAPILNVGSSMALNLQRGVELKLGVTPLSTSTVGNQYGFLVTTSSEAVVAHMSTVYIHHPFRYGLINVLDPMYVSRHSGQQRRGLKTFSAYMHLMCRHETVIFESGVHDFGFPDREGAVHIIKACTNASCSNASLLGHLRNETWRLNPFQAYRQHLQGVVDGWRRCRRRKPHFRPIFKLAMAPHMSACPYQGAKTSTRWSLNMDPSVMASVNAAARDIVHSGGFETMDTFPIGLHAPWRWYDGGGADHQHSAALSEVTLDALLSQICA